MAIQMPWIATYVVQCDAAVMQSVGCSRRAAGCRTSWQAALSRLPSWDPGQTARRKAAVTSIGAPDAGKLQHLLAQFPIHNILHNMFLKHFL